MITAEFVRAADCIANADGLLITAGAGIRINSTDEEIGANREGIAFRMGALDGLNGIAQALVGLGFLNVATSRI